MANYGPLSDKELRVLEKYRKGRVIDPEDEGIIKELASLGLMRMGPPSPFYQHPENDINPRMARRTLLKLLSKIKVPLTRIFRGNQAHNI